MKNIKHLGRRGLALFLALMLCLSLLNLAALASDDEGGVGDAGIESGSAEGGGSEGGSTEGGEAEGGNIAGGGSEDGSTEGGEAEDGNIAGGESEDANTDGEGDDDANTDDEGDDANTNTNTNTNTESDEAEDVESEETEDGIALIAETENEIMVASVDGPVSMTGAELLAAKDGTGKITLVNDVNLTSYLPITTGSITLDLNGYTLDGSTITDTNNASVIKVTGGTFTLEDSSGNDSGKITGGHGYYFGGDYSYSGGGVAVSGANAKFIMKGGTITGNHVLSKGGGVYVSSGTFEMNGGTITGNTSDGVNESGAPLNNGTGGGGGVYINGNTTSKMTGGTITGNTSTNGGGVYITNGTSNVTSAKPTFTLEGGTITGNNATNGGGMYINSYADVVMKSGEISENTASSNGGGVYVYGSGNQNLSEFVMKGGTITKNVANGTDMYTCGGVYLAQVGCWFIMSGGEISENTTPQSTTAISAGVFHGKGSNLSKIEISGGRIINNTTGDGTKKDLNGSSVGTVTITGGIFSSSSYLSSKATYTEKEGKGGIYYIVGDAELPEELQPEPDYDSMLSIVSMTVKPDTPVKHGDTVTFTVVVKNDGIDPLKQTGSRTAAYEIVLPEGLLLVGKIDYAYTGGNVAEGGRNEHGGGSGGDTESFTGYLYPGATATITFNAIVDTYAAATPECTFKVSMVADNGKTVSKTKKTSINIEESAPPVTVATVDGEDYYSWDDVVKAINNSQENPVVVVLMTNIEDQDLTVKKAVELDLNGNTLKGTGNGPVITIDSNGKLTLKDSSEEKTGTITGGNSQIAGGGVYVNGGEVTMLGGNITGNTAARGGGVNISSGAFDMQGGTISGNTATGYEAAYIAASGDGVFVQNGGTFIISEGTIKGADHEAVFVQSGGTATINGGYFSNEPSGKYTVKEGYELVQDAEGERLWHLAEKAPVASVKSSDGTTTNYYTVQAAVDAAKAGETVILLAPAAMSETLSIDAGKNIILDLAGCELKGNGQNPVITVKEDGKLTLVDNSDGKTGTITGGGRVTGDRIPYGSNGYMALYGGGGVYVKGTFVMQGGTITGNTLAPTSYGGGVLVNGGTFTMTGGEISGNTASYGGGVYVNDGVFTVEDGTIRGDVYIDASGENVTITGGKFTDTSIEAYLELGMVLEEVEGEPGLYTPVEKAVARVESSKQTYATLEAAIENTGDDDTVTLLDNITLTNAVTISKTVTLDLNGRALTTGGLQVTAGELTIRDSGSTGKISATNYAIWASNTGAVTVESGAVIGGKYAIFAGGNSSVNVKGGELKGTNTTGEVYDEVYGIYAAGNSSVTVSGGRIDSTIYGIAAFATAKVTVKANDEGNADPYIYAPLAFSTNGSKDQNATIEISGGTLKAPDYVAVYLPSGTLTVSGTAKIEGGTGILVRGGTLIVEDGEITSFGTGRIGVGDANPDDAPAAAIAIDMNEGYSGGAVNVTIRGGKMIATGEDGMAVNFTVKGETATAESGISITGGSYSDDLAKGYVTANGSTLVQDADSGYYVLGWIVTFDYNDGRTDSTTQGVKSGEKAIEPGAPERRTGYTFTGWYTDKDDGEAYTFDAPVEADIHLYAKWQINPYTVTFDANGGDAVASQTKDYGTVITLPEATRTGYTFNGWKAAGVDELYQAGDEITVTDNLTLTAEWTINTYVVTFDSNGGSAVASQTKDYGTVITLPEATRTGYTFNGWKAAGVDELYQAGDEITVTDNLTLTANWTINQYTVTFETVGGSDVDDQTVDYNETVTVPKNPTKAGHTFAGWTGSDGKSYQAGDEITVTDNLTLTAQWTINTYTVTFDSNGGSAVGAQSVNHGDTATRPASNPARAGYTFRGWYTSATGGAAYDFETPVTGNITLYAQWTVTPTSAGGTGNTTTGDTSTGGGNNDFVDIGDQEVPLAGLPFMFKDVKEGDWFYDAVKYVFDAGMMEGTSSEIFAPNSNTTRAMIVTVLYRLENEPDAGISVFQDVDVDTWYTSAVAWGEANGIVKGYSDTEFGPNDQITREQMAAILYRYAKFKGYDVSASGDLSAFIDGDSVSAWFVEEVKWGVGAEMLSGRNDGTLDPTGYATRAEIATILMRFCEKFVIAD